MANIALRLPANVPGDFFVDSTCIDCDACRQIAPETFSEERDVSVVYHQPENETETKRALMALVACPTASIGTVEHHDAHLGIDAFPSRIADHISHRDDVADHERFAKRFGCERVMHVDDGAHRLGIEQVLRGDEPMKLDKDLIAIPVPGHTRGHAVLLYRNKFLFTGDHLAWSPTRRTLTAFRSACWYSWEAQTRSMEKLLSYDFEWVLPGHGRIHHDNAENMRIHLTRCVEWMKTR